MQPERQPSCLPVRPSSNKRSRALAVVLILVLGIGLRLYAAPRLSIGNDERVYLQSSLEYANFIRDGKWGMFIWHDFHPEHPPLHKILYGIALLTQPRLDYLDPQTFIDGMSMYKVEQSRWGLTARLVAVILGSLTVLTLALVNPIAGLFYAVHTVAVQFNSAIFLEALPSLTSLLCALCYLHWYDRVYQKSQPMKETILWLGLSSAFLGMSAASKYTYAVVGLSITIHFTAGILLKKNSIRHLGILAAWGILAIVFFYILDPYIWKHPISRLLSTLQFHVNHSQSTSVTAYQYPFYQPLIWLSGPNYYFGGNASSLPVKLDTLIGILALIGLPRLFTRQPFYVIWLFTGLVVLLFWQTKWIQYTMIIMVPLCKAAAMGASGLIDLFKSWLTS